MIFMIFDDSNPVMLSPKLWSQNHVTYFTYNRTYYTSQGADLSQKCYEF